MAKRQRCRRCRSGVASGATPRTKMFTETVTPAASPGWTSRVRWWCWSGTIVVTVAACASIYQPRVADGRYCWRASNASKRRPRSAKTSYRRTAINSPAIADRPVGQRAEVLSICTGNCRAVKNRVWRRRIISEVNDRHVGKSNAAYEIVTYYASSRARPRRRSPRSRKIREGCRCRRRCRYHVAGENISYPETRPVRR